MNTDNAIEITGLTKRYRDFTLNQVSFSVPRGYVMGLIGPNGAGRTTIIKLIMNLVRRNGGEVKVFGQDNLGDEVAIKSRIGFVPDTLRYYNFMRARHYKSLIAPFYTGWDEAVFRRLAERFGLPLSRRLGAYSRGMRMKFSLALAMSHNADLLWMHLTTLYRTPPPLRASPSNDPRSCTAASSSRRSGWRWVRRYTSGEGNCSRCTSIWKDRHSLRSSA